MTATTFLTTGKLLLLLQLVVVLFVAQVSAPSIQERPLQVETNDEKIANFREEVENTNNKTMTCIQRVDDHDEVVEQYEHYTKRILAVVARAYKNRKDGRMAKIRDFGSKAIEIEEAILQFHTLFVESKLILPLQDIDSSLNDIVKMSDEVRIDSKTVLRSYYDSEKKEQITDAIEKFFDKQKKDKLEKRKNELANDIVPFVRDIFWSYDGAIDYITRQYKEHCRDPESVVQQFASYYIKVWWSSVTRVTNEEFDPTDWALWNEFMATACPFPDYSSFNPNTLKSAPKEKIQQFPFEGATPLDLVDFEQEIEVPEQVKNLRSHLTMIEGSFKNCDLVGELIVSFSKYKIVLSENGRKAHDENLWIGYQKKLIVLLTIVQIVYKESEKAENYLEDPKQKFKEWHSHWWKKDNPIPKQIVLEVDRALHRSKYYNNQDDTLASQKLVILTNVLKFLFGKTVQFVPPKKFEILTDSEKIEDVKIPEEIRMFYTSSSSRNQMMIKYSEVMDKVVVHFSQMSLLGNEKLDRGFNVEAWALLVLTIVPDLEKIPKESIQVVSEVKPEEVTNKSCCGKALNWVSENKCYSGLIVAFIIGVPSLIAFSIGSQTTATEEALPNSTWSTESPDYNNTGAWLVWLIVGAMIIGAILLVGVVLYLICRTKRKRNHSGRDSTSNAKTKNANLIASTVSTQNSSSSKRPSTSSLSSRGASYAQSRSPVKTPTRDLVIKAKQRKVAARKVCRKVTQTSPVNSSSIVVPIASSLKPSPVSPGGSSISVLYASRNKSSKVESKVASENSTLFTSVVIPSSTCPVSPPKKVKESPTRTPNSPPGKAQSPTRKDAQKKKKNPNDKK